MDCTWGTRDARSVTTEVHFHRAEGEQRHRAGKEQTEDMFVRMQRAGANRLCSLGGNGVSGILSISSIAGSMVTYSVRPIGARILARSLARS